jgi:PD-(D/E)XK endonuclease
MDLTSNQKGAIAETAIAHDAVKHGVEVYRPVAEGGRFDLIFLFADGSLVRVQCKWANLVAGAVTVRLYSCRRAAEGMRTRTYTTRRGGRDRRVLRRDRRVLLPSDDRIRGPPHRASQDRTGTKRSAEAATLLGPIPPWGYSSAGRAFGWQPKGRGFESP